MERRVVCRMQVAIDGAAATMEYGGTIYRFCSAACASVFAKAPANYVAPASR